MALELVTPPVLYPLTEAYLQERLVFSDDDMTALAATVDALIAAATNHAEEMLWGALITQTWDYYLDEFPEERFIRLPKPPLQSVTGVFYTPDGEAEAEFTDFVVDAKSRPGRIVLDTDKTWPTDELTPVNGVRIQFVCGFGDAPANIPPEIIEALIWYAMWKKDGVDLEKAIEHKLAKYSFRRF